MKQYSDTKLSELQHEGLKELIKILAKQKDEKELTECLECLLTKSELEDLGKRWLLVKEIDAGTTQREIAQNFHVQNHTWFKGT